MVPWPPSSCSYLYCFTLPQPDCSVFSERNVADTFLPQHPTDNAAKLRECVIVPLRSCVLKVKFAACGELFTGRCQLSLAREEGWGKWSVQSICCKIPVTAEIARRCVVAFTTCSCYCVNLERRRLDVLWGSFPCSWKAEHLLALQ